MRCVAHTAVFPNRLVLPQEGAACLRVALIAGLVERIPDQVARSGRSMGLVAVAAGHQAGVGHYFGPCRDRVPGLAQELGALFLVNKYQTKEDK